jgi:hypothetical protein
MEKITRYWASQSVLSTCNCYSYETNKDKGGGICRMDVGINSHTMSPLRRSNGRKHLWKWLLVIRVLWTLFRLQRTYHAERGRNMIMKEQRKGTGRNLRSHTYRHNPREKRQPLRIGIEKWKSRYSTDSVPYVRQTEGWMVLYRTVH